MGTGLKVVLIAAACIAAIAITATAVTAKRGFSALILSVLQGVVAIFAVNLIGMATGTGLAVNWYSLGAGAALGAPGVISMLLLNVIFGT